MRIFTEIFVKLSTTPENQCNMVMANKCNITKKYLTKLERLHGCYVLKFLMDK